MICNTWSSNNNSEILFFFNISQEIRQTFPREKRFHMVYHFCDPHGPQQNCTPPLAGFLSLEASELCTVYCMLIKLTKPYVKYIVFITQIS